MTDRMKPLAERFNEKWMPEPMTGCHLWIAAVNKEGYGQIGRGGTPKATVGAHRVSWELHVGPIPAGQYICHRCDTPACVNPDHLFLGTHPDNMADMVAKGRAQRTNAAKTACPHGHEYTEENTRRYPDGARACRECHRASRRAERRRAALLRRDGR